MAPFQEGKVHQIDCLEGMRQYPDKHFDLVLTDPPYGINIAHNGTVGGRKLAKVKDYGHDEWDNARPSKEYFNELQRISQNQIIFGGNYFTDYLPPSRCWIVWDKENTGNFADCELCWTSFDRVVVKYAWTWNGMLQQTPTMKEHRVHPTQKPVGLIRNILNDFSKPGDFVLDPFAGSGSIGVACLQTGRRYIGFDLSQKYCDLANLRFRQTTLPEIIKAKREVLA